MNYFPIFSQLQQRPVLVVGGGSVALRKIMLLQKAQAKILLVAEQLHTEVAKLVERGVAQWVAKSFHAEQLDNVFVVIATTDDQALNQRIAEQAEKKFKLCNVVDNQALCTFIMPSIIDRGDLQVAVSTAGKAPVLARLWREKLEALLPHHLKEMTALCGRYRDAVKAHFQSITQRRIFWENLFSNQQFVSYCNGCNFVQAEQFLQHELEQTQYPLGEVTLVGAGPGDPELLTIKGLRYIQQADVVLYDALVSDEIMELVRRDAERVYVGKRAAEHAKRQIEINQLLVSYAQQGKRVVRLKGGDPFVFGRGGEELETLLTAGIHFNVIPGITAAVGVTAYAGIPLTHRDYAQSATFITGHSQQNGQSLDWQTLAMTNHTLVIYMGTLKAGEISQALLAHGRARTTPVAVISNGTQPNQEVRCGVLTELAKLAEKAPRPALIVIGEVVALQQKLAWFAQNNSNKEEITDEF